MVIPTLQIGRRLAALNRLGTHSPLTRVHPDWNSDTTPPPLSRWKVLLSPSTDSVPCLLLICIAVCSAGYRTLEAQPDAGEPNMEDMPDSSALQHTANSNKRKRARQACDHCRTKKIRCESRVRISSVVVTGCRCFGNVTIVRTFRPDGLS